MTEDSSGNPQDEKRVDDVIRRVPGAEFSSKIDAGWGMVAVVILLVGFLAVAQPDPYRRIIVFVSDGIGITILVTVVSFIFTLVVGLFGGLGRLSKNKVIYGISTIYVEFVRGIPLLVQLLWWYFAFPVVIQAMGDFLLDSFNLEVPFLLRYRANPVVMAIIGFVFCYGAYMSEIYRAGIQSISRGQMEAARSLGMTYVQAMRYVILPQAIRVILPPVGNEFIALLKDSSLVSVVAVTDLTRRGREFMSQTYIPIETWFMVALLYLILTLASARVIDLIEARTRYER
jgi:polar amino acid transport system permease protein